LNTEQQRKLRQRARFTCENPSCDVGLILMQRAHIDHLSQNGAVDINNFLWLCESCHRKYEPQGASAEERKQLLSRMEEFRDRPKMDSLVSGLFDDLLPPLDPENGLKINLGSVELQNLKTFFSEPDDAPNPAFLRIHIDGNLVRVEGRIKTKNGFNLIEFYGAKIHFHTKDIWDIERKARSLKLWSKTRNVWIEIAQKPDLSIYVRGEIYMGGKKIEIDKEQLKLANLTIKNISFVDPIGVSDAPIFGFPRSPLPRPYGHLNPNVDI